MKLKIITLLSISSLILITGCTKDPMILKQSSSNDIERNIDHRIDQFNKTYYQNNFKTIEIADSEREIGIKSINKSNYTSYKQEHMYKDDLDIIPKTKIKVISRSDITVTKSIKGNTKTYKKTQIEKIQVLSKNNIHDSIDYKNKYKKHFPFVFGVNNSIFKRTLETNIEYIMAIDSKQRIGIYKKSKKCNKNKNKNDNCYLDIKNYKYSPNFKKHTTIHFKFNSEKLEVFNQKFNISKEVGDKLKISLTKNRTLYMNVNK